MFLAGPMSNLVVKPTAPLARPGTYPGGGFPHLLSPYDVIILKLKYLLNKNLSIKIFYL